MCSAMRRKKEYPPGTFIPTPARVCAIVQLCLAFAIVLWNMSQPFMGELFAIKSQQLLYQDVMGLSGKAIDSPERQSRLDRNRERFHEIDPGEKQLILDKYERLGQMAGRSFWAKMERSLRIVMVEMPLYERLWLILSFILSVMLLKRVEGARPAIWILPLLAFFYSFDNYLYSPHYGGSADAKIFPKEEIIVSWYVDAPLSSNLLEQKEQLIRGWNRYLIEEWSKVPAPSDPREFAMQAEVGEFMFNVQRLIAYGRPESIISNISYREPMVLLGMYILWNFFFAMMAWHYTTDRFRDKVKDPIGL